GVLSVPVQFTAASRRPKRETVLSVRLRMSSSWCTASETAAAPSHSRWKKSIGVERRLHCCTPLAACVHIDHRVAQLLARAGREIPLFVIEPVEAAQSQTDGSRHD